MLSLILFIASSCSGPFSPPTGFDKNNEIVLFDYEVAVGHESSSDLTEKAKKAMVDRRCAAGDCNVQPRLWTNELDGKIRCVMVVAEKEQAGDPLKSVVNNNQKNTTVIYSPSWNTTTAESDSISITSQNNVSGALALVGSATVVIGIGAGVVGVISLIDAADGLYFEPNSPDVSIAALSFAGGSIALGAVLFSTSFLE
jgi:hypothetical protein